MLAMQIVKLEVPNTVLKLFDMLRLLLPVVTKVTEEELKSAQLVQNCIAE